MTFNDGCWRRQLGYHLHVGIFDAVVHRLDEMARAAVAHPGGTGRALVSCADRLKDMRDAVPVRFRSAAHDRRAVLRAFLSSRHADAKVRQRSGGKRPPIGIVEVGVATVDDQVVGPKQRSQRRNLKIDRFARRDHQNDRARLRNALHQVFKRRCRNDRVCKSSGRHMEVPRHLRRTVPDGDGKTFFREIQRKGGAHGSEANQADLRFGQCQAPVEMRWHQRRGVS